MTRMRAMVAAAMMAGAAMSVCSHAARGEAEAQMQRGAELRDMALARLDPLLGSWSGPGTLRNSLAEEPTAITSQWKIERGFGGEFVRMEFRISREGRPDSHWVGYFTFHPDDGKYHTTWTWVSAGRDFTFHETGVFDPGAMTLSLVSVQPKPGGDAGETIEVASVFSLVGEDQFTVKDTRPDSATGKTFTSLRCDLTRTGS